MFCYRQLLATLLLICGMGNLCAYAGMVVINEIMFHPQAKQPEYLVISNLTATPLDIAKWRVTEGVRFEFPDFSSNSPNATLLKRNERIVLTSHDEAQTRACYRIPADVRVFGPWTGKLSNEGERITVRDKNGALVCSTKYGVTGRWPVVEANGYPLLLIHPNGRLDDGVNWTSAAPRVLRDSEPRTTNITINEIMFDPPSEWAGSEYIELFNRGAEEVDVSGWKLCEVIEFEFAPETRISPQGYLVVAADVARMRAIYGDITLAGNFKGRLRGEGEVIRLTDRQGSLINEVAYNMGAGWPELSNGGGSSLELINSQMDNSRPSAWAVSMENQKGVRRHYSFTNIYRELGASGEASDYRELHFYLAGRGHAVLENVKLLADGTNCLAKAEQLSVDGSSASGWLCQGTHAGSFSSNGRLHLVSDGRGDNRVNHAELDAPGLRSGQRCELHFEARWVSGNPRLVVETWDGSLSQSVLLEVPSKLGTPGRENSRASHEPPPQVDSLTHQPAVPRSADKIRIAAHVRSATPLREVKLLYRLDNVAGDEVWRSVLMFDDGTSGSDTASGGSVFKAELPTGFTNGTIVQFCVHAVATNGLSSDVPRAGTNEPALLVVDDRELPGDLRAVRLVISAHDLDAMKAGGTRRHGFHFPRLSNHYFNATAIEGNEEIIYGAKMRQSGSAITRDAALRKFKLKLPQGQAFRGRREFVFDDDAAEGKAYHNRVARYLLYQLGSPANENEFVRLAVNSGPAMLREEVEPVGNEFLDRNFKGGHHGELYRIDDEWRLLDNGQTVQHDADWTYQGIDDLGAYRRSWMKRTRETEDDFSRLIALFKTLSESNGSAERVDELLDAPATLRMAAVRGYIGDWDNFTMQRCKNGYLFRPDGESRFQLLHWDSDEAFLTGQPFYGERIKRWVEVPEHDRLFRGYLVELVRMCSAEPTRIAAWLTAEREAAGNSVFQATYLNFFKARATEVWQAIGGTNTSLLTKSNALPMRLSGQPADK